MDNLSLFADTLQQLMAEKNVKPVDIHEATKINLAVIYNWIKRVAMPTLKSLVTLSDYFCCSIDYLTGRSLNNYYTSPAKAHTFPQQLKTLLNEKNISIRRLSAETHIAKSAICYFLNGTTMPLLDNLVKLAVFFGCSIDHLIGRE